MASKINPRPVNSLAAVVFNEQVMPGIQLLWLESPEMAALSLPGQFAMLKCGGDTFLRRPLSIHRLSKDKSQIAFLFAVVGKGTVKLSEMKPGQGVDILGPLGNGFVVNPKAHRLVLIAGGLGIAPLAFLADTAIDSGKSVSLLLGAATSSLICPEHLRPADADCVLATEDGSCGRQGYITQYLPDILPGADQFFACGPTPMFRTLAGEATLADKDVQVSLEIRMACGLGACYGCTVKTKQGARQVCKHGPVFKLDDIIWEELADI